MAGLLNFKSPPAVGLKGLLAQQFDPRSMRYAAGSEALLQAGLGILNRDPYAPPTGIAGLIGRGFAGAAQGARQGQEDFYNNGFRNVQLSEMQREQDSREAQSAAMEEAFKLLNPQDQSWARAFPDKFAETVIKTKFGDGGEGYNLGPGQVRYDANNKPVAQGPPRDEGEGRGFIQEQKLRKEYIDQQKPFEELRAMYQRMIAGYEGAATDQTGASDIALVFSYMKMLDPTSVVRENEQATAQNAAGVPDQIKMMWNKMLEGQRLPQSVRDAFMDQATRQYEQQLGSYGQSREGYQGLAGQYPDVDPSRVAPDLTYGVKPFKRSNISPDAIDAELRRRGVIQ